MCEQCALYTVHDAFLRSNCYTLISLAMRTKKQQQTHLKWQQSEWIHAKLPLRGNKRILCNSQWNPARWKKKWHRCILVTVRWNYFCCFGCSFCCCCCWNCTAKYSHHHFQTEINKNQQQIQNRWRCQQLLAHRNHFNANSMNYSTFNYITITAVFF